MGRDRRNRGGALGLLIGAVGHGVGMAAEYHEHRKQKKDQQSRQVAQQDDFAVAGPSSAPAYYEHRDREMPMDMNGGPPSYAESAHPESERSLAHGRRPADDKKQAKAQYDDSLSSEDDLDRDRIENDEEDWALDDAQPPTYEESEQGDRSTDGLVRDVLNINATNRRYGVVERNPLPFPVIIPQRRPGSKGRGFIRAYAPVLNECGIDQETFLAFLKKFHQSSHASPIFPIIQVSSMIAGFAPSVIAMAVTTVVGAAAGIGGEMQSRQRTNNFLDRMNQELFQPAGLYAMIMKYKPETDAAPGLFSMFQAQKADLSTNQLIAKYSHNLIEGGKNGRGQKFRMGDGTTRGAIAVPEAAPLIFPDLDTTLAANGSKETFKDKTRDAKKFLADYMDRRAQTKYASEDPTSSLVVPVEGKRSKSAWANPDHAMYKGGLIGLVSGGALSRGDRLGGVLTNQVRSRSADSRQQNGYTREQEANDQHDRDIARYERYIDEGRQLNEQQYARYERLLSDREWREQSANSYGPSYGPSYGGRMGGRNVNGSSYGRRMGGGNGNGPAPSQGQSKGGGIRRLMKQDVMYLMIVNLPSEAELLEARRQLQQR